ncbi:hypothetical protein DL546_007645 [Coniochaeta pulveracea]|uniref:Uncharacterized protein n=1 Tax=Coniochaeta pulveracea TaxID=177199 RepID=A0A420YFV0_9PEZI|nr:hypothetical protein DL546_007645 [Coniochaeta pulveracea]
MDAFITRKKRKLSPSAPVERVKTAAADDQEDNEPTEFKLAMLASLYPALEADTLLDVLLAHNGSVPAASTALTKAPTKKPRLSGGVPGAQTCLQSFGQTLHLYTPESISAQTPCTLIPSFLPPQLADTLLTELLVESETFSSSTFKLFDNIVTSPHSSCFFVSSDLSASSIKADYLYNGSTLTDVRPLTSHLEIVKPLVQEAVNAEIQKRIASKYGGKKLRHQSTHEWHPNAAFVNRYAGGKESVGWHSDQLTYLGPRAVIGSLSLGVSREFRVRRVLPTDEDGKKDADAEGQIAIHLPHNSLLVMHAEMQEEWKHSVAPAQVIDPHPIAGNKRINVTYRDYRPEFHPRYTPRCKCGVPTVLRVVQKKKENFGRYFWMCHAGNVPGKTGCDFFLWAEFDEDGNPLWEKLKSKGENKLG